MAAILDPDDAQPPDVGVYSLDVVEGVELVVRTLEHDKRVVVAATDCRHDHLGAL